MSYGIFGLIDAIDKFDPERGFKFETYAISRIKGAIIDELRSIDWVPRSVRAKARAIERAYSKLENELKRCPDDAEVAAELDITEAELARRSPRSASSGWWPSTSSLDGGGEGGAPPRSATPSPTAVNDPVAAFEVEEMKHLLADAINRMPDRERLVLTLYYYEGLTLAEIGDGARRHREPRCQIHTKAILQLGVGSSSRRPTAECRTRSSPPPAGGAVRARSPPTTSAGSTAPWTRSDRGATW